MAKIGCYEPGIAEGIRHCCRAFSVGLVPWSVNGSSSCGQRELVSRIAIRHVKMQMAGLGLERSFGFGDLQRGVPDPDGSMLHLALRRLGYAEAFRSEGSLEKRHHVFRMMQVEERLHGRNTFRAWRPAGGGNVPV